MSSSVMPRSTASHTVATHSSRVVFPHSMPSPPPPSARDSPGRVARPPSWRLVSTADLLATIAFATAATPGANGSRAANPMELYQNQVTRVQGGFSLRMFHRSFALLMLQANIEAPCAVLDFPLR